MADAAEELLAVVVAVKLPVNHIQQIMNMLDASQDEGHTLGNIEEWEEEKVPVEMEHGGVVTANDMMLG